MQLLAFAVIIGWTTFWACILFFILRAVGSLRISSAAERTMLLDIHQAGVALTGTVNRNRPDVVVFDDESEVGLEPSSAPARRPREARPSRDTNTSRRSESATDVQSSSDTSNSDSESEAEDMQVFEPSRNYVLNTSARGNNTNQLPASEANHQPEPVVVEVPDSSESSSAQETPANNNIDEDADDPVIDPMILHQRLSLERPSRSSQQSQQSQHSAFETSEDSSSEAQRNIAMIRAGTVTYKNKLNDRRNKNKQS
jgi:hypothetical protein